MRCREERIRKISAQRRPAFLSPLMKHASASRAATISASSRCWATRRCASRARSFAGRVGSTSPVMVGRPTGADHRRSFRQGSQCFYIGDVYDVLTMHASPMVNWPVYGHLFDKRIRKRQPTSKRPEKSLTMGVKIPVCSNSVRGKRMICLCGDVAERLKAAVC